MTALPSKAVSTDPCEEGDAVNAEFAYWLKLSGLANKELARRVRRKARAKNLDSTNTQPSRIRGWLAGQQPTDYEVAVTVAEVLAEACGSPLTPRDLGFTATGKPHSKLTLASDLQTLVDSVDQRTRTDLLVSNPNLTEERQSLFTGAALVKPIEQGVIASPGQDPQTLSATRVNVADCEQIESAAHVFRQWDNASGGGLRRKPVVAQLSAVSEVLRGSFDTPLVRQRAFLAAADLAQLAGWMSYDSGLHSSAQRYFALGLDLARESGDRLQGARMLYCMARQMLEVGRATDALDLLELALYRSRRSSGGKVTTLLLGLRARALAQLPTPDVAECERTIEDARLTFDRITDPEAEPRWVSFYDRAELSGVIGACHRDLARRDSARSAAHASNAVQVTHEAITQRTNVYQRSQVLDLNNLAAAYLLLDEPEQAATIANRAITLAGQVRSARIIDRFRETATEAKRYDGVAELEEFRHRVVDITDSTKERQP